MNISAVIGFAISIITLGIYCFFLAPKQIFEVLRPHDWLTKLRWIILALLVLTIITSIPGSLVTYYRIGGHEYETLRNISTVAGNVSKLGTAVLLVLVYTYRRSE